MNPGQRDAAAEGGPGSADPALVGLLLTLTALSGVIDAVCVFALSRVFVANMTGNLVFVGLSLAALPGFSIAASLYSLAGFVIGVEACHVYARTRHAEPLSLLRDVTLVEAALLAVAALICGSVGGHPSGSVLHLTVVICAVALGGQNTMARRAGIAELTTAVMTGTLVGLVGNWSRPRQRASALRQGLSIVVLVAGAFAGALVVHGPGATTAIALTAALAAAVAARAGHTQRRRLRGEREERADEAV
jgi:uncharacterized membrane protein YoaK (UPF0700 family)